MPSSQEEIPDTQINLIFGLGDVDRGLYGGLDGMSGPLYDDIGRNAHKESAIDEVALL